MRSADARSLAEALRCLMNSEVPPQGAWPDELISLHALGPLLAQAGDVRYAAHWVAEAQRAGRRSAALKRVVGALAKEKIQSVLLKGVAYAGTLYPDPATRPMTDMDLLVRQSDFAAAREALGCLGFVSDSQRHVGAHRHAETFRGADGAVDLHRHMVQPGRAGRMRGVWESLVPAPHVEGAYLLSEVDQVVFHMAHVGRSELLVAAVGYIDGHRLLATVPAHRVLNRARELGLHRLVSVAIAMHECIRDGRPRIAGPLGYLMPSTLEICRGAIAPRPLQLARKLALTPPSKVPALAAAYSARAIENLRLP